MGLCQMMSDARTPSANIQRANIDPTTTCKFTGPQIWTTKEETCALDEASVPGPQTFSQQHHGLGTWWATN